MTNPGRNEVRCRACGELLGTLNAQHDQLAIEPRVHYLLTFAIRRFDLFCPRCGVARQLWMDRVGRIMRERMLESAPNLADCEQAVG